jgi:hypothetical protein
MLCERVSERKGGDDNMKRLLSVAVGAAVLALLAGGAWAFMGPGAGHMGMGGMGHGMMRGAGAGPGGCPGMAAATGTQAAVTEEKARELAKEYADKYLPGYTVETVLPFTGRNDMTMYSIELKGPKDEVRVLHINPFGNVMPFGGPWRRGA